VDIFFQCRCPQIVLLKHAYSHVLKRRKVIIMVIFFPMNID
jgi:hypothetical protein